eukprot:scaffold5597_cov91-Skeletonema_marinoi.AAC.1
MVTRTVIRISPEEAKAKALTPAPAAKASSSSSSAAVDSLNNDNLTKNQAIQKPKSPLCNHPSCTKRAQLPSPLCWKHGAQDVTCKFTGCYKKGILHGLCPDHGGLVQLCRSRGCINKVNLEKRGGLCYMHRVKGQHDDDDDSSSEDEEGEEIRLCRFRGCISRTTADEGLCDRHSTHENDYFVNVGGHKRALPTGDSIGDSDTTKKRRKVNNFAIDLTDVPPQSPIPKSAGRIKDGASKYTGVCFYKQVNKWSAQIMIGGKQRSIGYYNNEEDAAVDYARAVFKYKGQGAIYEVEEQKALDKAKMQRSLVIDLSDVPPQPPIPKSAGHVKEGASKYTGVSFNKANHKWNAQIMMDGKQHCIDYYDNEEDAAVDYARAVFKYRGQGALDKARERNELKKSSIQRSLVIDLSDVPPQSPILKRTGRIKEGASKYTGVCFYKQVNKWSAQIMIGGKQRSIGYYNNEEDAAVDYARAVFKYTGQGAPDKAEEQNALVKARVQRSLPIDLSDVPPHPPIPKSAGHVKEGASKYTGVSFDKQTNKWISQIMIEGKIRRVGRYEDEEEAAVDYARAIFKYKGQGALDKAEEQISGNKARMHSSLTTDLSDVTPQPPIAKSAGRIKDGASKYTGVSFNKASHKWNAQIMIDGKQHCIGFYDNEEEAAVDYARAVFKYRGQGVLDKAREQAALKKSSMQRSLVIDLSDVPPQPPIPKSAGRIKEGASKYTGVSFHKRNHKWNAQIMIDGKQHCIGFYDNEEEAAVDYARAIFKYKGQGALDKAREQAALVKARMHSSLTIDLSDVPPQPPIPKMDCKFLIEGKQHCIGYYEDEKEAAVDYARALFKYKGDNTKKRPIEPVENSPKKRQRHNSFCIDLTDVPMQTPVPKSAGHIKQGASKYTGANKWKAQIKIEGKVRRIGSYENEEEAAVDYARALHKYRKDLERQPTQNSFIIDLNDVPPQPLILKNCLSQSKEYIDNTRRRNVREGSSKYTGIYFEKGMNKWKAQIMIEGIVRSIGYYEIEEEAAADYARAVFIQAQKRLRNIWRIRSESETSKSGYKGVKRNKSRWEATLNGKNLGTFDTKEEASGIYARARYYVDKGGEPSAKKKQRAIAAVPEESIDLVAV